MNAKKTLISIIPAIVIILELLPFGAVLNFGRGTEAGGAILRKTYSYFNPFVFVNANFGPFITAVLSCVLLSVALLFLFKGKCNNAVLRIAGITCVVSLLPLLYGVAYFSIVGGMISILLFVEVILALTTRR